MSKWGWSGARGQAQRMREHGERASEARASEAVLPILRAREKEERQRRPDPYTNPDWHTLMEGDMVFSLVDPRIRGVIKKIEKLDPVGFRAFLKGHRMPLNLTSLMKLKIKKKGPKKKAKMRAAKEVLH